MLPFNSSLQTKMMFIYCTANSNYSPAALFWLCWHSVFTISYFYSSLFLEWYMYFISSKTLYVHKQITSRIRSIVDGSLVHCYGRSEFESRHRTLFLCCFVFVIFFDFIFLLIYLFIDIIHYHFQTISVKKYGFNYCKHCIPYWVDAFSGISPIRSVLDNVPFDGHFV